MTPPSRRRMGVALLGGHEPTWQTSVIEGPDERARPPGFPLPQPPLPSTPTHATSPASARCRTTRRSSRRSSRTRCASACVRNGTLASEQNVRVAPGTPHIVPGTARPPTPPPPTSNYAASHGCRRHQHRRRRRRERARQRECGRAQRRPTRTIVDGRTRRERHDERARVNPHAQRVRQRQRGTRAGELRRSSRARRRSTCASSSTAPSSRSSCRAAAAAGGEDRRAERAVCAGYAARGARVWRRALTLDERSRTCTRWGAAGRDRRGSRTRSCSTRT